MAIKTQATWCLLSVERVFVLVLGCAAAVSFAKDVFIEVGDNGTWSTKCGLPTNYKVATVTCEKPGSQDMRRANAQPSKNFESPESPLCAGDEVDCELFSRLNQTGHECVGNAVLVACPESRYIGCYRYEAQWRGRGEIQLENATNANECIVFCRPHTFAAFSRQCCLCMWRDPEEISIDSKRADANCESSLVTTVDQTCDTFLSVYRTNQTVCESLVPPEKAQTTIRVGRNWTLVTIDCPNGFQLDLRNRPPCSTSNETNITSNNPPVLTPVCIKAVQIYESMNITAVIIGILIPLSAAILATSACSKWYWKNRQSQMRKAARVARYRITKSPSVDPQGKNRQLSQSKNMLPIREDAADPETVTSGKETSEKEFVKEKSFLEKNASLYSLQDGGDKSFSNDTEPCTTSNLSETKKARTAPTPAPRTRPSDTGKAGGAQQEITKDPDSPRDGNGFDVSSHYATIDRNKKSESADLKLSQPSANPHESFGDSECDSVDLSFVKSSEAATENSLSQKGIGLRFWKGKKRRKKAPSTNDQESRDHDSKDDTYSSADFLPAKGGQSVTLPKVGKALPHKPSSWRKTLCNETPARDLRITKKDILHRERLDTSESSRNICQLDVSSLYATIDRSKKSESTDLKHSPSFENSCESLDSDECDSDNHTCRNSVETAGVNGSNPKKNKFWKGRKRKKKGRSANGQQILGCNSKDETVYSAADFLPDKVYQPVTLSKVEPSQDKAFVRNTIARLFKSKGSKPVRKPTPSCPSLDYGEYETISACQGKSVERGNHEDDSGYELLSSACNLGGKAMSLPHSYDHWKSGMQRARSSTSGHQYSVPDVKSSQEGYDLVNPHPLRH
ncbi:uncharacterized protein [Diadema antillarum]|uniref:uncharacterized protein isoform X2 n=1 Tax=Diadema antillarum TaxID=105358 RepID=UPI003A886D61